MSYLTPEEQQRAINDPKCYEPLRIDWLAVAVWAGIFAATAFAWLVVLPWLMGIVLEWQS